jgi:lipoate-protein ligase A
VETLGGDGADAAAGLEADFAMLRSGHEAVRVWTCARRAVVLGVSRDLEAEVDVRECLRRDVALLRRASGGGTVLIGPGTVQYAFVLPHRAGAEPPSLDLVKRACNRSVRHALSQSGIEANLDVDPSGDLRAGDRKIGGLALRRQRGATLLHGTLLAEADLDLVAALLRHPQREPAWRRGRSHREFLANLGSLDLAAFAAALRPPTA